MKFLSVIFACLFVFSLSAITRTWNPSISSTWNFLANWNPQGVPTVDDDVIIPTGETSYPSIAATYNAVCNSISMQSGSSLTINGTLTVDENFSTYGAVSLLNELSELTIGLDLYCNFGSSLTVAYNTVDINIGDDLQFNTGSNINLTAGRIVMTGSSAVITTTVAATLNTLIIAGNCSHSAGSSNLTINSTFNLNSSATYYCSRDVQTIFKGNVSAAGATLGFNSGTAHFQGGTPAFINVSPASYFNNVIITKTNGIGVTLSNNIDINNYLIINSGILYSNTRHIWIGGSWSNYAGVTGFEESLGSAASVIFNGTGTQTINLDESFNWVTLNNNGGSLYIQPNAEVSVFRYFWDSGSLFVEGSLDIANLDDNGLYGDIVVYGNLEMTQVTTNSVNIFGNLSIFGGTVNIYGGLSPSNFTGGGSLTMNVGTLDFANVGMTIASDFTCSITGGTIRTTGDLRIANSTFNPAGGTIEMYGSGYKQIFCYTDAQLYNLTISKNAGEAAALDTNLNINGELILQSGNLYAHEYTINLAGDFHCYEAAAFFTSTGTVVFDGTSSQSILGSVNFNELVINKTAGTLYIYSPVITCQNYNWEQGDITFSECDFTAFDMADNGFWGTLVLGGEATVNFHQDSAQSTNMNGSLSVYSGSLNIYGGNGFTQVYGTLTQFGGTIDFKDFGVYFGVTLAEHISGGTIRSAGNVTINLPTFNATGNTLEIYGSGSKLLQATPGAALGNLLINNDGLVGLQTDLLIHGFLNLQSGQFQQTTQLTVEGDVEIHGMMNIMGAAQLRMYGGAINVYPNAILSISGTVAQPVYITSATPGAGAFYGFNVMESGFFDAEYASFEYMNAFGINLHPGALVSPYNPFSHCTFRNGASGRYSYDSQQ